MMRKQKIKSNKIMENKMNTVNNNPVKDLAGMTLAEIVTENIKAAVVFEEYGLDFCCKGKRSLTEACAEKNVNFGDVINSLSELEVRGPSLRINDWTPDFLVDYIINNHHQYIRRMIPTISLHADKVASVHGQNHPETIWIADLFLGVREELENHMMKEERILFPYIKQLCEAQENNKQVTPPPFGTIRSPISMMEAEHTNAGEALYKIRELSDNFDFPVDACNTFKALYSELKEFEEDLHKHIHLENNVLFPTSIELEEELL